MLMNPHADEMAQIVAEEEVPVVTTGAGNPGKYVAAWKEAGIKVFPVVAAVALAKRLAAPGRGRRHRRGHRVRRPRGRDDHHGPGAPGGGRRWSVPVIAAGGIADGRQLTAAFALGACGVQVGTCLLASEECPIHDNYKQAILKAKDSDTTVTGRSGGSPGAGAEEQDGPGVRLRMEKAGCHPGGAGAADPGRPAPGGV